MTVYGLYWPVSHWSVGQEAWDPTLPLDRAIPLSPLWMHPYAAVLTAAILPLFVVRDLDLFRRCIAAYVLTQGVALVCFVLLPVHMTLRPDVSELTVDSFATWGLALAYLIDKPTNCFPSLHVAMATLAALCCLKADRTVGILATGLALAIAASTLLIKQHFAVDVVAGAGLTTTAWAIFVHPFDSSAAPPDTLAYSRRVPMLLVGPTSR